MSGRIYDSGINPKCDICGSNMYSSEQMNFNGCRCKRKGCNGNPIYEINICENENNKPHIEYENGKIVLYGKFTEIKRKQPTYTFSERFRNFLYNLKQSLK